MKSTIKLADIRRKYLELYNLATDLTMVDNPCNIHCGVGKIMKCNGVWNNTEALCCETNDFDKGSFRSGVKRKACKHWAPDKGCTVKSLRCKLWFCSDLKEPGMESTKFLILDKRDINVILGESDVPIQNERHAYLIKEMRIWLFDRYFREGQEKAIQFAYKYRAQIVKNIEEENERFLRKIRGMVDNYRKEI